MRDSATRTVMVPDIVRHTTRALPASPDVGTACYLGDQMCGVVSPCAGGTDAWGQLNQMKRILEPTRLMSCKAPYLMCRDECTSTMLVRNCVF